jgi:hypothetical protein
MDNLRGSHAKEKAHLRGACCRYASIVSLLQQFQFYIRLSIAICTSPNLNWCDPDGFPSGMVPMLPSNTT